MKNIGISFFTIVFFLSGCDSPEEKQKKDEVKILYQNIVDMSEDLPCSNLASFMKLKDMEKEYETNLFQEVTEDKIRFYSVECKKFEFEQKKEEVVVLYQDLVNMSQDFPCSNLIGFSRLEDMEKEYQTNLFQEVTEDKIKFYSSECEKYTELNNLGDWKIVSLKDDFGDFTGEKVLNLRGTGTYGDTFSRLTVTFAWGYEEGEWSILYLYENGYPVKGIYDSFTDKNNLWCNTKDSEGNTRWMKFYQYKNSSMFDPRHRTIMDENQKESFNILNSLVEKGDRVKFACSRPWGGLRDKDYIFVLDFKYSNNAKRIYEESN